MHGDQYFLNQVVALRGSTSPAEEPLQPQLNLCQQRRVRLFITTLGECHQASEGFLICDHCSGALIVAHVPHQNLIE